MADTRRLQQVTLLIGIVVFLAALGIYLSLPGFRQLWVWPHGASLGLAFVGAWLAGGAATVIWIGVTGHFTVLRVLMLTMAIAFLGSGLRLVSQQSLPGNERYLPFALFFIASAILAAVTIRLTYRLPASGDALPPAAIRWVFLLFSAILLLAGTALLVDRPNIFPIPLSTDVAFIYGAFFLGSFAYYFHGFLWPSALNATGQMLSFLVYDLLLIPPFLMHLSVVDDQHQTSLLVYLGVLIASALFCAYFLLIDPRTRMLPLARRAVT
jgi:hypothetical protein